jgi:DNA-binding NarL/FixJ family response regulator
VIVDDHRMVAEGLARVISDEDDIELAGVAGTVADALALVDRETPHVVLMDFHLPDGDGAEATEKILQRWPQMKVLLLSGSGTDDLLARSIEAGCSGFLDKTRPTGDIVAGIRAADRGESVVRVEELAGLLAKLSAVRNDDHLTTRELEVLRLLARSHSTEAMAKELFLSLHTVRNHVQNILTKMGAHSKLEAVAIAVRDGILRLDEMG